MHLKELFRRYKTQIRYLDKKYSEINFNAGDFGVDHIHNINSIAFCMKGIWSCIIIQGCKEGVFLKGLDHEYAVEDSELDKFILDQPLSLKSLFERIESASENLTAVMTKYNQSYDEREADWVFSDKEG